MSEPTGPREDETTVKPNSPLSYFKKAKSKNTPDLCQEMDEEALADSIDTQEDEVIDFSVPCSMSDDGDTFSKDLDDEKENEFPLRIPGVKFSPVHGKDMLLEHPEDLYKPPVRVKLTLPKPAAVPPIDIKQLKETAEYFDVESSQAINHCVKNLMEPLDDFVGLKMIKQHLEGIIRLAYMTRYRASLGLPVYPLGGHMLFLGNPGTGKTETARLVAAILHNAGVLKHGHLIEVDRAALTGEYIGWSEAKTHLACTAAQGGVLFIDEAYALSDCESGYDFGYEAINVLMKRMEDDADKFIVIAAGYKEKMENFIRSNPGLRSRFQHRLEFQDYTLKEIAAIFERFCDRYGYHLEDTARSKLIAYFKSMKESDRVRFGNARGVRTLFENTLGLQARRLAGSPYLPSEESLQVISAGDIPTDHALSDDTLVYMPTKRT